MRRARFRSFAASAIVLAVLLVLLVTPVFAGRPAGNLQGQPYGQQAYGIPGDGQHYLGLIPSTGEGFEKLTVAPPDAVLGTSVDLSAQLPPVGNQGAQGSCAAWASSYYYKTWSEKQEHTSWDLANPYYQYSPSFVYNQINGGQDKGSTFKDAFTLMQNSGDVDIAEMPYDQSNYTAKPTAAQKEAARPYRIAGDWRYFFTHSTYGRYSTPNDITGLKSWLDSGKMLVIGMPVYKDFPAYGGNPAKAYYDYNGSASLAGGHGVCVSGYDDNANPAGVDADHKGGFKMVNSWGPTWNGNGFLYLSYDFMKRYVLEAWSMTNLSPDDSYISALSKSSARVGESINISGKNFGTLRRNAKVSFNGASATQASFTDGLITAQVPAGATSGPLTVYDWDGKASNPVTFTIVTDPAALTVTSITPASGVSGGAVNVQIGGSGFKAEATAQLVQGSTVVNATSVVFVSDSQINCGFTLPSTPVGAYDVVVRNLDGKQAKLAGGFLVTSACGAGGLVTVLPLLGLLSLAGLGGLRGKRRGK